MTPTSNLFSVIYKPLHFLGYITYGYKGQYKIITDYFHLWIMQSYSGRVQQWECVQLKMRIIVARHWLQWQKKEN